MSKIPTFTMFVGIAGSGKSTLAMQLMESPEPTVWISSDNIREEFYGDANCQDNPKRIFAAMKKRTIDALSDGFNVIYDATNLRAQDRFNLLNELKCKFGINIYLTCYDMICQPQTAIDNQSGRDRKVPESVIHKMAKSKQSPSLAEGWDQIISYDCYSRMIVAIKGGK